MITSSLDVNKGRSSACQHISEILGKVTSELQQKCSIGVVNTKDTEAEGGNDAKQ